MCIGHWFAVLFGLDRRAKSKQQGKRQSKQAHTQSKRSTRMTQEDRFLVVELRKEGLSTKAIADEVGKSTRTVHNVLKAAGMNQRIRSAKKETPRSTFDEEEPDPRKAQKELIDKFELDLLHAGSEVLSNDPDVAREFLYKKFGMKAPKQNIQDLVYGYLREDPEYGRRLAEHKISQMERGGRSELDIVREGVELVVGIAERITSANTTRVVQEFVSSGELRKILVELVSALKASAPVAQQQEVPSLAQAPPNSEAPPSQPAASLDDKLDLPKLTRGIKVSNERIGQRGTLAGSNDPRDKGADLLETDKPGFAT